MKTNLKALRKEKKMTQAQLAAEIGATKRQVGAWERDENELPMDYAYAIADVFGCSLDDISGRVHYAVIDFSSNKMTFDELELLKLYRNMDGSHRSTLLDTARAFSALSEKDGAVDERAGFARTVDAVR